MKAWQSGIVRQLTHARAALERNLAGTLQAIHLFGSAIDGGLKPYSDIDLLVTVNAPLPDPVRYALMMDLLSISAAPGTNETHRALEVTVIVRHEVVPWRYPPLRELQFGEWLREPLQHGCVEGATVDHDLAILLTKARQHSINLVGMPARDLFDPVPKEDLAKALFDTVAQWNSTSDWQGDERNIVLALARIWFSAASGEITSKDAAAAWVLERLPDVYAPVVHTAREAYLGSGRDDLAGRTDEVQAFIYYAKAMIGKHSLAKPS
ncbi:AadA family aminoglycoside 3''-O-nucleotidyltransferase [Allopusillimonas ginsengisoli]|uniref:AadA family aminoglycoside 3''-O-nucleotidyltransferase n=1 Tax=Allopusillimonas ginsengisoli TaxID=453575 RepID=UPI00101F8797|nr:AadA family aminoglycoside 3''-O-nucleotidyltransferase [Allopusillimonas ginsengisoli]TEA78846.1 AadA family aminoglycoside 3''-O-nucleotidyltransferase [Allopusillimonas ginsengisoli]